MRLAIAPGASLAHPVELEINDEIHLAAGRLVMEAILVPASLLPGHGAEWEPVDDERANSQ